MKRLLFIPFLLWASLAQAYHPGLIGVTRSGSAQFCTGSEIVCERFEGSGTPTCFSSNAGANYDYDRSGNQWWYQSSSSVVLANWTARTTTVMSYKIHIPSVPEAASQLFYVEITGPTLTGSLNYYPDQSILIYWGGTSIQSSAGTFLAGQDYEMEVAWVSGSGTASAYAKWRTPGGSWTTPITISGRTVEAGVINLEVRGQIPVMLDDLKITGTN